jgi:hypothetical protein
MQLAQKPALGGRVSNGFQRSQLFYSNATLLSPALLHGPE